MYHHAAAVCVFFITTAGSALHGQRVHGRLLEDGSGVPIGAASVVLLDSTSAARAQVFTDSAGGWTIEARPGLYSLLVQRIGYATVRSDTIRLTADEATEVELHLSPRAVRLAPIVASERAASRLDLFHQHRQQFEKLGIGDFFDRGDLENWINHPVSAVLQSVPYLNGVGARSGRLGRSRRCQISYYIDGVRMRSLFGQPIDDVVRVVDLEGIEVYRGQSVLPAEFSDPQSRGCPVVALWTRRAS
jgi:hypothetical protein